MKVHLTDTKPIEGGGVVTHPRLAFAFNPIAVKVTTIEDGSVSIKIGNKDIEIVRETKNNEVYFDLSAIARSMFDRTEFHKSVANFKDEILYKKLVCEIYVNGKSASFEIPVIWGAMQIGETYSQSKNLKMFRGYPFSVPFFFMKLYELENNKPESNLGITDKNVYLKMKQDDEPFVQQGSGVLSEGKYNFTLNGANVGTHKKITFWVDNRAQEGFLNTFDLSFDYTFTGLGQSSIVVDVDVLDTCDDEGYYMRWINSYGEYSYWLFRPQVYSTQIENKAIEFDQYYTTVDFTDKYHVGTNTSVGKKIKKTIQLYADFVDSTDFDSLMGLVQSPVVDLYMGEDKWMNVNIQPATFPKGKEHLQDFSFILELPQIQIQSL